MKYASLETGVLQALGATTGFVTLPTEVEDIPSFMAWCDTLGVTFSKSDDLPPEEEIKYSQIGIGAYLTREQKENCKNDDEFERLKKFIKRNTLQSVANIILGMALVCDHLVWRVLPEEDWQKDFITDNLLYKSYCRIGARH
jgi:hypothetical protein